MGHVFQLFHLDLCSVSQNPCMAFTPEFAEISITRFQVLAVVFWPLQGFQHDHLYSAWFVSIYVKTGQFGGSSKPSSGLWSTVCRRVVAMENSRKPRAMASILNLTSIDGEIVLLCCREGCRNMWKGRDLMLWSPSTSLGNRGEWESGRGSQLEATMCTLMNLPCWTSIVYLGSSYIRLGETVIRQYCARLLDIKMNEIWISLHILLLSGGLSLINLWMSIHSRR
jgi:hypothetical protein